MKNVKTLIDIRIAEDIKGMPHGTIKLVQGEIEEGNSDYALFINDEYLGSLNNQLDSRDAVLASLGKIRELLALLSE